MVKFKSWQAVIAVFACLIAIQFVVLFSIFLRTFLRGLPGTVMGAPIAVTLLTLCAMGTSSR